MDENLPGLMYVSRLYFKKFKSDNFHKISNGIFCKKLKSDPVGSSVHLDCFWAYQSILIAFYNGGLWENLFWIIYLIQK